MSFKVLLHLLNHKTDNLCISFPKSGRTWLRVMLDQLGVTVKYTHAGAQHADPKPIEAISMELPHPRTKILFLHRDPLDTVVSGYHQAQKRLGNFNGTLSEFIRHPNHGLEKVYKFNKMWKNCLEHRPNTMILSYEDLHIRTISTLMQTAFFFGTRPSLSEAKKVCEQNTFEKMRERERSGAYKDRYKEILSPTDVDDADSFKVRKGQIGGHKDELDQTDLVWARGLLEALERE